MYFNTMTFVFLFGAAFSLYYLLPYRHRINVLMIFSVIFFLSNAIFFLLVLLFLAILDYYSVKLISKKTEGKRFILVFSISLNLAFLIFFKYLNFLFSNLSVIGINIAFSLPKIYYELFIPIGFSFFVFKSISFLIESYRNNIKEKVTFKNLFLYFIFFPTVLAGPIDRPNILIREFNHISEDFKSNIRTGLSFVILGYIKKSVIADRLSTFVDLTYLNINEVSWLQTLIAVIFYTFQIYLDFSGYSDIALGLAKMFGINIIQNFEKPYFAKSIQDFWRRWHVSLSLWLRDYLFLPIAYKFTRFLYKYKLSNKTIEYSSYIFSILITMFLAGLWHGANSTFVIWGLLMGFYIVFSFITRRQRRKVKKFFRLDKSKRLESLVQTVFLFILISFAWIFFRVDTVENALIIITKLLMPGIPKGSAFAINTGKTDLLFSTYYPFLLIVLITVVEKFNFRERILQKIESKNLMIKYAVIFGLIFLILFLGNFTVSQFIYFKF